VKSESQKTWSDTFWVIGLIFYAIMKENKKNRILKKEAQEAHKRLENLPRVDPPIEYFKESKLHRIDGPAVIWPDGNQYYYFNGEKHRFEGPAVIHDDGTKEWYINGVKYRSHEHPFNIFRTHYNLSNNYEEWSNEYKVLFKLIYGGLL
jgi:hypothetical protein